MTQRVHLLGFLSAILAVIAVSTVVMQTQPEHLRGMLDSTSSPNSSLSSSQTLCGGSYPMCDGICVGKDQSCRTFKQDDPLMTPMCICAGVDQKICGDVNGNFHSCSEGACPVGFQCNSLGGRSCGCQLPPENPVQCKEGDKIPAIDGRIKGCFICKCDKETGTCGYTFVSGQDNCQSNIISCSPSSVCGDGKCPGFNFTCTSRNGICGCIRKEGGLF